MENRMRTVLICHAGARIDEEGLARWLASFSTLAGIVVLKETAGRGWKRIRTEIRRSGWLGMVDVAAFRFWYRLFRAADDRAWEAAEVQRLCDRFPSVASVPRLETTSPNSPDCLAFLQQLQPDVMLARCKSLIKPAVFQIPVHGTYVLHPGMCPEYRNAHGAFWALANGEPDKVAVTMLRIDEGVDTGPIFGYFSYPFDARRESHIRIQLRCVTENLDAIRERFQEIVAGLATPIDVTGRRSAAWGQPWFTRSFGHGTLDVAPKHSPQRVV